MVSDDHLASIFEDSPAPLRAFNLAEQGRDLIFPAVDPDRLASALQVFNFAIEEDSECFGGYAGFAQVHATYALLSNDQNVREEQLSLAETNAERAKYLAPGAVWSLSAQPGSTIHKAIVPRHCGCRNAPRAVIRATRTLPSSTL